MTFLPEDYELPKGGGSYLKITDGTHKFRILTSPAIGYKYFNNKSKPVRSKTPFEVRPADLGKNDRDGKDNPINEFWAVVVYNRDVEMIQVLEIEKKTIKSAIIDLINDKDYGDPKGYDLKITRSGQGMKTEYKTLPTPPKPFEDEGIIKQAQEINLEALFDGGNPFDKNVEVNVDADEIF